MNDDEAKPFSEQLEDWRNSPLPKTVGSLGEAFPGRDFAVIFLLLMALPALPLPTGGLSHAFEVIVMLLAAELVLGRRTIWLPKMFLEKKLSPKFINAGIPYIVKKVRWVEKFSRPRFVGIMRNTWALRFFGLLVIGLTLVAFTAVPFSGLDTLPALGVVFISLAIILEDIVGIFLGILFGSLGIAIIVGLGAVIAQLLR